MGVGVLVERWGEGGREETEREREREREYTTLPDRDNSEPKNATNCSNHAVQRISLALHFSGMFESVI